MAKNTFAAEVTKEFNRKDSCAFYRNETTLKI